MPLTMPKTSPFQSTLPARGATQQGLDVSVMDDISIHAPREGSDTRRPYRHGDRQIFQSTLPARGATGPKQSRGDPRPYFNPRSPRGERRIILHKRRAEPRFQSTLPARGATPNPHLTRNSQSHFNPRSPRGERRLAVALISVSLSISIHAPREGSDFTVPNCYPVALRISIHAPREGSDIVSEGERLIPTNFNPRSPRGERLDNAKDQAKDRYRFQSTLPARGATPPLDGSDRFTGYFNPRSPRGERRP